MVSRPVFNADSDYAIGGSIFLVMTEVSTVTWAASILPIFMHIMVFIVILVHKKAMSYNQTSHYSKLGIKEAICPYYQCISMDAVTLKIWPILAKNEKIAALVAYITHIVHH